jgi:hypothetical protein
MDSGVLGVETLGEQEFAKAESHAVIADVVDTEIEVRTGSPEAQRFLSSVR